MQKSNPFVLCSMCAGVFLLPIAIALTFSSTNDRASREPKGSDKYLLRELESIEHEATRRQYGGNPSGVDLNDLNQRLDRVESVARSRLDKMNRKSGERGYSLSVRKKAAYRTLVEQGCSPREAQLTVDAMVEHGMLPDPPLK